MGEMVVLYIITVTIAITFIEGYQVSSFVLSTNVFKCFYLMYLMYLVNVFKY